MRLDGETLKRTHPHLFTELCQKNPEFLGRFSANAAFDYFALVLNNNRTKEQIDARILRLLD